MGVFRGRDEWGMVKAKEANEQWQRAVRVSYI